MSHVQNRGPLDISIPELSPNLVGRILELESIKGIAAAREIEEILATTLNQATFSYGFRVLSKFGYRTEELLAMARQYVTRVRQATETHPDWRAGIYPPVVTSLYVASEVGREGFLHYVRGPDGEFRRVD